MGGPQLPAAWRGVEAGLAFDRIAQATEVVAAAVAGDEGRGILAVDRIEEFAEAEDAGQALRERQQRCVAALRRRGVAAPFHWAWSFFALVNGGLAVYMIGRAVVLKRRTVSGGWPPLWVWIGTTALGFVITIVWMIGFLSKLFTVVGGMAA